ncbi:MAG: hypothetical protein J5J00_00610 [Deltaproteobacteria bacterium]|nr:hypothetical protein [Deltaproteobacteria bacterium]
MGDAKVAFDFNKMTVEEQEAAIQKVVQLLAGKSSVLCIGASALRLAETLAAYESRRVTLLTDNSDFISTDQSSSVRILVEPLASDSFLSRFTPDEFDAVVLTDPPLSSNTVTSKLPSLLTFFTGALVVSIPELITEEQAIIREQALEIERLKKVLRVREETISWYSKRLREHLVSHYKLEGTHAERKREHELSSELERKNQEYSALLADRDRIKDYADRLSRYSADHLPLILRYPVKALIALWAYGPLEPIRIIRKKKSIKSQPGS